jgi:quercetin dioxygenase-like cupin family protein
LTEPGATAGRLELLARSLPAGYQIRLLILEPGTEVAYEPATWRDSLVEVECGQVELHLRDKRRIRVRTGEVLWLSGLGVLSISNPSGSPAALTGLARRH